MNPDLAIRVVSGVILIRGYGKLVRSMLLIGVLFYLESDCGLLDCVISVRNSGGEWRKDTLCSVGRTRT